MDEVWKRYEDLPYLLRNQIQRYAIRGGGGGVAKMKNASKHKESE